MRRHVMTTGATAIAVALALAGCGNGGGSGGTNPGAASAQISPAQNADPQTVAQANALLSPNEAAEQARQVVLETCMAAAGGSWTRQTPEKATVYDLLALRPLTIEQARQRGYNEDRSTGEQAQGGGQAFLGTGQTEAPVSADLFGIKSQVNPDGCLGKSLAEVYGSVQSGMQATGVVDNAMLPAVNAALASQEMSDVTGKWSACMKQAGENFPTPDLATMNARQQPDRSMAIALADAKCRESVRYEQVRTSQLNRYLATFLRQHEAEITTVLDARKVGAQNAERILAG
ncbi:hypothetical protein BKD30_02610 [Tersicoccus phoenicis]|uniref:Lipoprotein n=1 Tax=Tersicoccus phoenicis TaxID=554083 RepID=A0A1R1LJ57_9MICC|nr:hypothetical protein [Tersicoccus phoenicis]OMH27567.1 hypothetical protein BKD30_02610 [Tersicoccus phoenicis]